ncbi:MAG: SPOR domain-containing protein [Candidatus Omnitrophota bacterium]
MKKSIILLILLSFACCGLTNVSLSDIETAIIQEDFEKAENLVTSFLSRKPKKNQQDEAIYYLGLSKLRLGYYKEARDTFDLLLSGLPTDQLHDKAYCGIIDSYYLEGEYAQGLRLAQELIKKSPRSELLSLIYLKLARGNLKLTYWDDARMYLEKIIRDFPESFEAHLAKQLLEERQFFAVQVGAFLDRQRALSLVEELEQKGEYAYMVETTDRKGQKFYRVRVGEFTSLEDAKRLKTKLSKLGYPTRIYP